MPRLGHYSEKYELNGSGSEQPAASYGSFRRDEQGALLSHDHLLAVYALDIQRKRNLEAEAMCWSGIKCQYEPFIASQDDLYADGLL
ncbi:hypothetical protein HPB49_001968 [Dermacentor silvarum]|uniref:Uncharacterized protein n=1 Tax=Dermacentor silvarum TaxID=543639 RepID=A0ACB8D268_DERSI|nr:hypothetical protein HPB49_001968 [Dermacentor silvarum]